VYVGRGYAGHLAVIRLAWRLCREATYAAKYVWFYGASPQTPPGLRPRPHRGFAPDPTGASPQTPPGLRPGPHRGFAQDPTGASPRTLPKELSSFGILQYGAFFVSESGTANVTFGAKWNCAPVRFDKFNIKDTR
jgi:hypothetical protein